MVRLLSTWGKLDALAFSLAFASGTAYARQRGARKPPEQCTVTEPHACQDNPQACYGVSSSTCARAGIAHENYYEIVAKNFTSSTPINLRHATRHAHTCVAQTHINEELQQLSAALQSIREQERQHIAQELHDDLGQLLITLKTDLDRLRQSECGCKHQTHLVAGMQDITGKAIASLRRMALNLRPRALEEGSLYRALRGLQDEFSQRYDIPCSLYAVESELQLDDVTSTLVFRIVQEGLTNIGRHAHASNVTLNVYGVGDDLLVTISDDGLGISMEDLKKTGSLGLVGMRERVWGVNGNITVERVQPSGTCIDIAVPIGTHRK